MFPHKNACFHEAAHAVVQHLVGIALDYVAVYTAANSLATPSAKDYFGQCHSPKGMPVSPRRHSIVNLMAGMFGELLVPIPTHGYFNREKMLKWNEVAMNFLGTEGDIRGARESALSLFLDELKSKGRGISDSDLKSDASLQASYNLQVTQSLKIADEWLVQFALLSEQWLNDYLPAVKRLASDICAQSFSRVHAGAHPYERYKGEDIDLQTLDGKNVRQILESEGLGFGSKQNDVDVIRLPNLDSIG